MSTAPASTPASSGMADNTAGMVAYFTFIPAIIFLVMEPYNKNKFVRFHAFQSLFFNIAYFVIWMVVFFAGLVLNVIPLLGTIIHILLLIAIWVGGFVVWLMLVLKANKGEKWKLPWIGDFSEKQAGA